MKTTIILLIILLVLCLLDISVSKEVGVSNYPEYRFSELKEIGSITLSGPDNYSLQKEIKKEGRNLRIEILDVEHDIPASVYLPFYRFGHMRATLTFKATDPEGREIIDSVSEENNMKKWGLFLLPDLSLEAKLNSRLKDTLIKGIEIRLKENSNQT